ncbi:MAG: hypothetical protein GF344_15135 [Chitinivibrionales bacterium]|nr:hypothetical protein [Chitinivibrionales bacterium]MBD3358041.1 hypothetical protein [Chitinivibrionales bacterium]
MSSKLRYYVYDNYALNGHRFFKNVTKSYPIQIDDQDDEDTLYDFCNVFVTIDNNNSIRVDLLGAMPITQEMIDFVEIYEGSADRAEGKLHLQLNPEQIGALYDLADLIRRTADMGETVGNRNWKKISARTISSLYRFMRVIGEYRQGARVQVH